MYPSADRAIQELDSPITHHYCRSTGKSLGKTEDSLSQSKNPSERLEELVWHIIKRQTKPEGL